MADHPLPALRAISHALKPLQTKFAFAGGSIVPCLLDSPDLVPVRPTDDVDVIIEILTQKEYRGIEDLLRRIGFQHDISRGAPICRWTYRKLTVDIMPVEGRFLGLNTQHFQEALSSAVWIEDTDSSFRILSPAGFLTTKLLAFRDRGGGDYLTSHDLEDVITVIDGRADIVSDIAGAAEVLREFVIQELGKLLKAASFLESLPAHLPSDPASQARLPSVISKLEQITHLP